MSIKTDSLKKKIAFAIVTTIRQSDQTQQEIAELCKCSQPRISAVLNMRLDSFSIDALIKIARYLGCQVDFMILTPELPQSMKSAYMLPKELTVDVSSIHAGCEDEFRFS